MKGANKIATIIAILQGKRKDWHNMDIEKLRFVKELKINILTDNREKFVRHCVFLVFIISGISLFRFSLLSYYGNHGWFSFLIDVYIIINLQLVNFIFSCPSFCL